MTSIDGDVSVGTAGRTLANGCNPPRVWTSGGTIRVERADLECGVVLERALAAVEREGFVHIIKIVIVNLVELVECGALLEVGEIEPRCGDGAVRIGRAGTRARIVGAAARCERVR